MTSIREQPEIALIRGKEGGRRPLIGIRASHHAPPSVPLRFGDEGFHAYTHALADAGGTPIGIPANLPEDVLHAIFERLDGLCLPGGPDVDPVHYGESPYPELGAGPGMWTPLAMRLNSSSRAGP